VRVLTGDAVSSFDDATTWESTGPGAWTGVVPPDWSQGRSPFGGVTTAAAARAMGTLVEPGRRLRSLSTSLVGPVRLGEPVHLEAHVLRVGGSLTHTEARVLQGGTVQAVSQAAFGAPRPSGIVVVPDRAPPDLPDPEACPAMPYLEGLMPVFTQFIEMRWTHGSLPFGGSDEHTIGLWLRHRTPASPVEGLIGLLDAPPTPVLQMMQGPAPASTVRWSAHLLDVPDPEPGAWFWLQSAARSAGDGYATMLGSLYGRDGVQVAWFEQLVCIFDGSALVAER
jgi:acyl-CoA thioesterase